MPEPFTGSGASWPVSGNPGGQSSDGLTDRSYERQLDPEASIDDLDGEEVREFLVRSSFRGTVAEAMEHYGLAEWRPRIEGAPELGRGDLRLTNAALLLFGRRRGSWRHPRAGIRLFRVAGTERTHGANGM